MADGRRWVVLTLGTLAQAATCTFLYGIPMLVPELRSSGLSLLSASLVVSAPMAGLLLTLILWGAAADRYGERLVIGTGVGGAAILVLAASATGQAAWLAVVLGLAGAFGASVNAASGRMVMGWFPRKERGLAMGVRQTAQPLGVALAALVLPPLAAAHGVDVALLFPAVFCAVMATLILLFAADPARPQAAPDDAPAPSPYRGSRTLHRVHAASTLLVVPQFAVSTFTLTYLVDERHWDATTAGRMIFGFQLAGAAGRVATGVWSDRVGSRLTPMRQLAVASAAVMALISVGALTHLWIVVLGFGAGALVTVADNGLAYTSVAEIAGVDWSGRALGTHNTAQNVAAVVTSPALAALVGGIGYGPAFAVVVLFPLLAIPLTPVRAETAPALRPGRSPAGGSAGPQGTPYETTGGG